MIVVVGFMGAGKTTVGRMLAERLGLPFVDSDLVIEHQQRRTISEIFASEGEPRFRDIEQEAIRELLAGPPCVLAVGGGACGRAETRRGLLGHTVIYLHVEYDEAMVRVGRDEYRPLLHDPDLPALYAGRLADYERTATVPVRTTGRPALDVAAEVIARIGEVPQRDGAVLRRQS